MQYDRQIQISSAPSHDSTTWNVQTLYWGELVNRLCSYTRTTETFAEYSAMSKAQKGELKNIGGFVGGVVQGRRRRDNVVGRDIITLDLDNIPSGGTNDVIRAVEGLGCGYVLHSTRSHHEFAPKLRIGIPGSRRMQPSEYEPVGRKIAELLGVVDYADATCFRVHQLMYFPSCSSDVNPVIKVADKPWIDIDAILGMYTNWQDFAEWKYSTREIAERTRERGLQGNPLEKEGVVGAFCRTYDIHQAIDTFLEGVYIPVDNSDDRYSYADGSSSGGAVVYDNGLYLYSHHATDPISGHEVNAFDLVRVHKFGSLDDGENFVRGANTKSFHAMKYFASADSAVRILMDTERMERAGIEFSDEEERAEFAEFLGGIARGKNGIIKTVDNFAYIIANDPRLKGHMYLNDFTLEFIVDGIVPWSSATGTRRWADIDDDGLLCFIEKEYGVYSKDKILSAHRIVMERNKKHPVLDYFKALPRWEGVPRLDTLFVDFLGAFDEEYMRAVTRKSFVAAVARIHSPGCVYQTLPVIHGRQGLGKSTLLRKMGLDWFSDSVYTMDGKEGAELIQSAWLVEIAELGAYNKSDLNTVKTFLSKQDDQFRPSYGRHVRKNPRRCVFFGTTNDMDYLRDPTGGRRFWAVRTEVVQPRLSVFTDLTPAYVDQTWAEALFRLSEGETLHLSPELDAIAEKRREQHFEADPIEELIRDFLDMPIPEGWYDWNADYKQSYRNETMTDWRSIPCNPRDRVRAIEIWNECLNETRTITQKDARRINTVLRRFKNWEERSAIRFESNRTPFRGFQRKIL